MGLGYVEGVTHDYVRHGTTTLFTPLNVLNGAVLAECKPLHRHQEFLAFLRSIDKTVPADLDVHGIVDNYSSHKHPKVKAWLAARPRWHMHFIPTYSSWLNRVERFFSIITDKTIRRGSFTPVRELVQKIAPIARTGLAAACGIGGGGVDAATRQGDGGSGTGAAMLRHVQVVPRNM